MNTSVRANGSASRQSQETSIHAGDQNGGLAGDIINFPVDHDWLALHQEEVLEPDLPIIDPHHHLWDRPNSRYMPPDLVADAAGHNVRATVFVEICAMYRPDGPLEMRPVGETEMFAALAEVWSGGPSEPAVSAGVVGYANLLLGSAVKPVLEAHIEAGRGRFRGIRQVTAFHRIKSMRVLPHGPRPAMTAGMMMDDRFREGFATLAPLNLSFDAWVIHPQLGEFLDLARAFPETSMIINHIGGPACVGPYAGKRDEVFAEWSAVMGELSRCPNVSVKIGGMGMRIFGFGFNYRETPPSSSDLAEAWRPYVDRCIDAFGTDRCMFESNFPVDKAYYSYRTLWNAFKRLTAGTSAAEKRNLFTATARRIYNLPD